MKLIGCDRCRATFPADKPHSVISVFDKLTEGEHEAAPACTRELRPSCRSDLTGFFTHPNHEMPAPARNPVIAALADQAPTASRAAKEKDYYGQHNDKVRTCEICGRVGVQRFVQTDTGWRCAPTAVKCPGNKAASDIAPKPFQENVTLADDPASSEPESAASGVIPPGLTARCQNCSRTWGHTGVVLRGLIEAHELQHGHIVAILEGASA